MRSRKENHFVNRSKLVGCMAEKGVDKKHCAFLLNISYPAFLNKLKGVSFTEREILILKDRFGDSFFSD